MSVQVEKLEHNMVKLTIEIAAEQFEKACRTAYSRQRKNISVPGFRKGKVPQNVIERMYGEGVFYEDAANILINDTYDAEAGTAGLEFVSRPAIDVVQIEKGKPFIYTAEVAVRPEVTLGSYKGIEVAKQDTLVTDDDIAEELKQEQEKNSRLIDVEDRPAQNGDTVVIDYAGTIDGEAFDGGSAENHSLELGSGSFIPGFEEQLVGVNAGEEKDVEVTFPEDYHAKELAGKAAVFHCTVHKIQVKELPELNDDFAQDVSEFDTLDEYKNSVREKIQERKDRAAKTAKENEAVDKLIEASEMDIPDAMVDAQVTNMYQDYARQLQSQGIPIDMYMQYMGQTEESLKEQMKPQAVKQIQTRLVLEEVVKAEAIEISDERIDEEIAKMAETYSMEADKLKDLMGDFEKEQMKKDIAVQEAITVLTDNAKEA
ncbi:MAG: trigger factor [Lachnospiraceae bacterium]|nr:trigger factor [Lachnospiraceae bacterium]